MESIVSELIQTLARLAAKESNLLWNLKGKMQILKGDLDTIQDVLSVAEEKEHKDRQVQTCLRSLREVAYDAIDVFDEVNMEVALHPKLVSEEGVGVTRHFVRSVSACFLSCFTGMPNPIVFHHRMGSRIEDIMARLNKIKERKALMDIVSAPNQSVSYNTRETSSLLDEDQPVIGRDKQKQELIEMLCASDDGCVPALISVVGMGGVGKTTIAQAVYDDDKIKEYFSLRKWVFVGEKFDVLRIVEQLLSKASKQEIASRNPTLEDLHTCLISEIKDQKFFFVLDDAWNERPEEWDSLWRPLKCGAKGSKVLITTRSEVVAKVKDPSSPILKLEGLSNDVCWSIFEKIAFIGGSSEGHPVLKDIGMEIVKKLEGLPLAAKLIGGALNRNFTETYWRSLMHSEVWSDNLNVVGVLPSLLLSYQALPPHLKLCFQFCSLFPKDHRFDRETLVWMWMAQDYIKPIGNERVEDVGSHHFDELLHRSFFQYIHYSYVMHDLIHDLTQFVSDGQCLRVEDKKQLGSKQFNRIHHLSLFCKDDLEAKDLHQFNRTRTLLDLYGKLTVASDTILCQLLGRLRCIRVLNLTLFDGITSFPECISNLKHLRYLDLRDTSVKKLPESLCTLYNLQTLILPKSSSILPPKGMSKLVNLRNLEAGWDYFSMIAGIGKLTCLQELKGPFKVSKEKNEGGNIGELKGMNQLRGTLCIENLENVSNVEEAEGIRLKDKVFLHRLKLNWKRGNENEYSDSSEDDVIEALQPPQQLKELKLENHPHSQPPSWLPSLFNLVALELVGCENHTCVPSALGRLPCLTSLELVGMSGIKQVGPEFHCCGSGSDVVAFPSLQHLRFKDMAKLERWVVGGSRGVVEEGEIEDCNRELGRGDEQRRCPPCRKHPLRCDSFLPHLRRLRFESCPKLATISGLLRHHNLNALEQVFIRECEELVQLLGDSEKVGKGKLTLHNGPPKMKMLQALDIWGCPKLTWSEVEPLFLLLAPSSTSLTALRICLDAEYQHGGNFIRVVNRETSIEKEMALEFVGTNKRELLSWLLQPKRNPLKSLQYLEVINCDELTSFTEEEEQEFCGRNLPSLSQLLFMGCPNLCSLPAGLGHISSLTNLSIYHCPQILALPERGLPPTLCRLYIVKCSALHSLAVPPLLQRLYINRCPQLAEVTWGEMLPDDLIGSSNSLTSSSSSSSTKTLVKLGDVGTDNERLLSWLLRQPRRLEFLQKLEIRGCEELKTFTDEEEEGWRRNLPSLQDLYIFSCPNLRSLPVLPSLEYLFIRDCALLEEVMWLEMPSDFTVASSNAPPSAPSSSSSSSMMTPARLGHVRTNNKRLLSWLHSICQEPMTLIEEEKEGPRRHRSLPSLKDLEVYYCPNLCSLPEGLNIKPYIKGCPKLQAPPAHRALHWGCGFPSLRCQH